MSHYTIFIHCDDCHAVLEPMTWDTGNNDYRLSPRVGEVAQRIVEAHEVTCPCAPLRDHPAGEPRE